MKKYYGTWPDPLPSGKKPKEMKKPDVIGGMGWMEAQRDADVAYYEPLIQQERQKTIQEFYDAVTNPDHPLFPKIIGRIEHTIKEVKAEVAREMDTLVSHCNCREYDWGDEIGIKLYYQVPQEAWQSLKDKFLKKAA